MNTTTTITTAAWSLAANGGPDSGGSLAFGTGFHVVLVVFVALFAFLISYTLLKRAISVAGF